jgi:hypothetical protein
VANGDAAKTAEPTIAAITPAIVEARIDIGEL